MNESLARVSRTSGGGGGGGGRARRSFTLIELLVVMGVIAVLAVLTLMSMRAIANDARLASATNTVKAALDNARALAMKNNTIVLIVFRPRFEGHNKQIVEIVTAKWTGEAATAWVTFPGNPSLQVVDRFVPIPDVPVRALPPGTKVAGPSYGAGEDEVWVTQSHLPAIDQSSGLGEVRGQLIAIMYAPDGTTITRNSQTDSARTFVDFNNNGEQNFGDTEYIDYNTIPPPTISPTDFNEAYFDHRFENEETYVSVVPFFAVYDDEEARELRGTDWTDQADYELELTGPLGYITQFADRIHFNRYTGVVMK